LELLAAARAIKLHERHADRGAFAFAAEGSRSATALQFSYPPGPVIDPADSPLLAVVSMDAAMESVAAVVEVAQERVAVETAGWVAGSVRFVDPDSA